MGGTGIPASGVALTLIDSLLEKPFGREVVTGNNRLEGWMDGKTRKNDFSQILRPDLLMHQFHQSLSPSDVISAE